MSRALFQYINFLCAAAAKSLQSCPTLCDPRDGSPPGSPVPGILQARTLEWVAFSFSNVWEWKVKVKSLSHVRLLANPWTPAYQAPPSMGFSRQEYWSGLPLPSLISIITLHINVITLYINGLNVCAFSYWPKEIENLCPYKTLHRDVYNSFIHIYQNLKQSRCPSVDECINKL